MGRGGQLRPRVHGGSEHGSCYARALMLEPTRKCTADAPLKLRSIVGVVASECRRDPLGADVDQHLSIQSNQAAV